MRGVEIAIESLETLGRTKCEKREEEVQRTTEVSSDVCREAVEKGIEKARFSSDEGTCGERF